MILKAKGAPVEQLIHTLEQYCNAELDEKWMYELAELYNQAGMEQLCVMTCDKIMLMFGLGKYVDKAMELKLQYAPLNQYQMDLVENKEKYEAKLKAVEQEYKKGTSIVQPIENTDRRQLDREEEPVEDTAEDETVYAEDEYTEDYREEPAVTIQDDDITEEEPVSEEPEEELAEEPEETYETEEPETEDYEAGESEAEESEEEPEADEEQAVYETAAADEEIRASIHEARAQENLAREMSKLSVTAMEEDIPEDEMAQTRALADIREIRKGPVYTGSNHLMIEAEVPEKGLELAIEALRKVHKETGEKNQAAKISGEKLNRRGVFALADKLTGKDLIIEQAELQEKIDACNGWDFERGIQIAMDALRCPPADADVTKLSGGEKRRVALCRLLLQKPDMLLLDEPTNHLDAESVAWLEKHLQSYAGTVVMVTHDRYFLDNVTGWILELDRGQGIPYEGNYSSWLEQKRKRLEQEEKEETARQRTLASELEWIRKNPKARQAKSKARINAYDELLQAAAKDKITTANINIPMTERLGDLVIEAEHITKGYGDRILIDDLSFKIPKGAIVGIIGPNGAGKTTLFRMITGQEKPDSGTIRIGDTVDLGYVDQSRDELNPDKNVWEEISDGLDMITLGKKEFPSRAYVGQFNFKGGDQQKKVGQLSGGERNRVHLAKMLRKGANVILLDEPTNDLDVDTLRSLEEGIMNYPGCVLVTSHDRWFLDRLATHILAYEGNGHVEWFEGNFEEYEKDKIRRLGEDACNPHAMKYKPLER